MHALCVDGQRGYACFMHAVVGPLIRILVPNAKEHQSLTIANVNRTGAAVMVHNGCRNGRNSSQALP